MDARRFDALTKTLATTASRRRLLAGLGGMAAAVTLGRTQAAPKPKPKPKSDSRDCRKGCNDAAKTCRQGCAELKGQAKNACLKACKETRASCRDACPDDAGDDTDD